MLVGGAAGGEAVLQRGGRLGVAELDPLRQSVTPSHDTECFVLALVFQICKKV